MSMDDCARTAPRVCVALDAATVAGLVGLVGLVVLARRRHVFFSSGGDHPRRRIASEEEDDDLMTPLLLLDGPLKKKKKRREKEDPHQGRDDPLALQLVAEARAAVAREPAMRRFLAPALRCEANLEAAVAETLARRLAGRGVDASTIARAVYETFTDSSASEYGWPLSECLRADARAVVERDPAADSVLDVVLHFKGFAALEAHRVARRKWLGTEDDTTATTAQENKRPRERQFALWLQSRVSEVCGVDVHPAAEISRGVMFDHATGVVVGETAKIDEGCTILHACTLGATGKDKGDRHPKVGKYVLLGANVSILGNITIGDGAKIGAGSVVLRPVPSGATAVGAPARIVGRAKEAKPSEVVDQALTSVIPRKGADAGDVACVWRDIAKQAEPKKAPGLIGVQSFAKALHDQGLVTDSESMDLFFQLDVDQDGLVSSKDLASLDAKAARCCHAHCGVKRGQIADAVARAMAAAPAKPLLAAPPPEQRSLSDLENNADRAD